MSSIVFIEEPRYITNIDEFDRVYTYIGTAALGTSPNTNGWRIKRLETAYTQTLITWASGTMEFDKIWSDRTTYTYS